MTRSTHAVFWSVMSLVVAATVAWGIAVVGTPEATRLRRLDQRRLEDLQTIFREIQSLCRDPEVHELRRPLPATLDELAASAARSERINLADPETGERYLYVVEDGAVYELCATFASARDSDAEVFWNHPPGRHCFTVDVLDPP